MRAATGSSNLSERTDAVFREGVKSPSMPIRPLTRRRTDGDPYHRRAEVEAQIEATIGLSQQELLRRAVLADAGDPDYLRDETLVFFLRESSSGDAAAFAQLWAPFGRRLDRYALRQLGSLPPSAVQDAQSELVVRYLALLKASDDRADYCEVSFQHHVRLRATELFNQTIAHINRSARELRLNDEQDYDDNGTPPANTAVLAGGWEDEETVDRLLIKQVFGELERHFAHDMRPYQAWRLRLRGIPVGPTGAPGTITARFGISDRTIRNWLGKVEEFLVEWRKRNSK